MGLWFDSVFVLIAILWFFVRPVRFGMDGWIRGMGGRSLGLGCPMGGTVFDSCIYIIALLRLCIWYGCGLGKVIDRLDLALLGAG